MRIHLKQSKAHCSKHHIKIDAYLHGRAWWWDNFGVKIFRLHRTGIISDEQYDRILQMVRSEDMEMRRLGITLLLPMKEEYEKQMKENPWKRTKY